MYLWSSRLKAYKQKGKYSEDWCRVSVLHLQDREREHKMQEWESQDIRHRGMHWRSTVTVAVQREALVPLFSLHGFCREGGFTSREMDHWCHSSYTGHTTLVILVYSAITRSKELSFPVFYHSHHDLLRSHSICSSYLLHSHHLVLLGSQGTHANSHSSLFCKFSSFS